jgi:hypothetical protein
LAAQELLEHPFLHPDAHRASPPTPTPATSAADVKQQLKQLLAQARPAGPGCVCAPQIEHKRQPRTAAAGTIMQLGIRMLLSSCHVAAMSFGCLALLALAC